jgi:hypothetical protein
LRSSGSTRSRTAAIDLVGAPAAPADAGRRAVLAEDLAQGLPHSPVVTPAWAQAIERLHDVAPLARRRQLGQRRLDLGVVARGAPGLAALDLLALGAGSTLRMPPSSPPVSGEGSLSV